MRQREYQPADLSGVRTFPVEERPTRVGLADFARPCPPGATVTEWLATLPAILKADDLRALVAAVSAAHRRGRAVVAGIGGHVIKCGLGPLLVDLMERGILTAVAMNGGASIHDFEIAMLGRTSEDVADSLQRGDFGMVQETPELMNAAIAAGARDGQGMGRALGEALLALEPPFLEASVLAAGARLGVPVTVHVSVGGDTIHQHASADGAALGAASFTDFRLLVSVLGDLSDGGVYLNIGSAVVMPEVFLKALNLARNLAGAPVAGFTTANLDMLQHHRPLENVVRRPNLPGGAGGRGYSITGHHEIMVPLLAHLVRCELERDAPEKDGEG